MNAVLNLVSALIILLNYVQCCPEYTFFSSVITIKNLKGEKNVTVSGCVSPVLDFLGLIEVRIKDQDLTVINKQAFNGIDTLENIYITNNNIHFIMNEAFWNLTNLVLVDMSENQLVTLVEDTFKNLSVKHLTFIHNEIFEIEPKSFRNLNRLNSVNFKRNQLTQWDSKWFDNTPNLFTINLDENHIQTLEAHTFKAIPSLRNISFRKNKLKVLDSKTFSGIYSLDILDLAENQINSLHPNLFSPFNEAAQLETRIAASRINKLFLHNNFLSYIPNQMMQDLFKLGMLSIHSNPLQCTCYNQIYKWAYRKNIKVDSENAGCYDVRNPVCVIPKDRTDECVQSADVEVNKTYFEHYYPPTFTYLSRKYIKCIL